jgi:hypothetical protein
MLKDSNLSDIFWAQSVHMVVQIQNKGILRINSDKNPYGLWKGK